MRYAELFAGAGGLSIGMEAADWSPAWHAEIDENPRAVLQSRWPDVPLYGDVMTLDGRELVRRHGAIDILTGGSPCQDLSVAGKRAGLSGSRSTLFHEQMRLWDETGADLCLWENVYGALSSNDGKDFGIVLGAFVGAAVAVPSDGWRSAGVVAGPAGVAAWRCLDCQWFGPPQRRLRVFVLGTRTGRVDPAEVLLEPEGVRRHPPTRRETRERIADSLTVGANQTSGFVGDDVFDEERSSLTSPNPIVWDSGKSENEGSTIGYHDDGLVPSLRCEQPLAVLSFAENSRHELRVSDVSTSLTSGGGKPGQGYPAVLAFHHTQDPISGPSVPCLGTEGMGVLAFNQKQDGSDADVVAPALLSMPHDKSHANGGGQVAVCVTVPVTHSLTHEGADASEDGTGRGTPIVAGTLESRTRGGGFPGTDGALGGHVVADVPHLARCDTAGEGARLDWETTTQFVTNGIPRRLMPRECERLMGWPDDWTLVPNAKGKPMSDAARYKMIGNGVASPVAAWIAGRLRDYIVRYENAEPLGGVA